MTVMIANCNVLIKTISKTIHNEKQKNYKVKIMTIYNDMQINIANSTNYSD